VAGVAGVASVVIAAHNEERVLGRCLDALAAGREPIDVTVVANGCTDATAAVARARPGVRVLDLPAASKPAALDAGDAVAVGFPRIYLDADVVVSGPDLHRLAAAVATGTCCLAAVPRRSLVTTGRPVAVRAYYAVHSRLPAFRTGLFGRGVVALSAAGRARFDRFPDLVADDLFLDSLFAAEEKREVVEVPARVATPLRTADLLRRLARVRAGNAALRRTGDGVRPAARLAWLRQVVLRRPWLAPAATCYVGLTVVAAGLARRGRGGWGRDESSRTRVD
jgi:glycosyltransferase involved in cell wall biosynthesis